MGFVSLIVTQLLEAQRLIGGTRSRRPFTCEPAALPVRCSHPVCALSLCGASPCDLPLRRSAVTTLPLLTAGLTPQTHPATLRHHLLPTLNSTAHLPTRAATRSPIQEGAWCSSGAISQADTSLRALKCSCEIKKDPTFLQWLSVTS